MNKLFFELLQVAIGKRVCLSHTPSVAEWQALYIMALKQSLLGICFAGVQRLQKQQQDPTSTGSAQAEMLYLKWMGMAAKIQQRNEVVNRQCAEVQRMLAEAGFRSSILKGQGIASFYQVRGERLEVSGAASDTKNGSNHSTLTTNLGALRQSGDIDVWVDGGMQKAQEWCQEKYGKVEFDYINAHVPCYKDTEVELHWRALAMSNLFLNRKLQEWLCEHQDEMFNANVNLNANDTITTPSAEFNAFYILLHCYHHMFESGLGLRQLMDYYFVLRNLNANPNANLNLNELFKEFGMERFAKGVMWMMGHVFLGNPNANLNFFLGIEPDEREGRFLLKEVMQNGNFGHHDERIKKLGSGKMSELWRNVQHNWHLASHYPSEFLWQPVWLAYHYFWKRNLKLFTR